MEILIIVLWIVITFFVGSIAGIIGKRYGVAYPIALVSALVVMANIFANKIVQFGSFTVPAGVITFSMIFFITDLISERWGKIEARKAVWAGLMSEEAKQKQIAIEKTPRETIITYWFDTDSFAILKEESHSYATECEEASATIGGESSEGDCREFVVQRKIFGTFRSEKGLRITEVIMSLLATWRLRNLNTYNMLRAYRKIR